MHTVLTRNVSETTTLTALPGSVLQHFKIERVLMLAGRGWRCGSSHTFPQGAKIRRGIGEHVRRLAEPLDHSTAAICRPARIAA